MSGPDAEFPGGDGARDGGDAASARYQANAKSVLAAYVLWFFLGGLGLHRIYLRRTVSGLIMLAFWAVGSGLTALFLGFPVFLIPWAVWWLVDAFLIPGMVSAENNAFVDRMERGG
jgi:TM2 domain-containing membrane protein YozV